MSGTSSIQYSTITAIELPTVYLFFANFSQTKDKGSTILLLKEYNARGGQQTHILKNKLCINTPTVEGQFSGSDVVFDSWYVLTGLPQ